MKIRCFLTCALFFVAITPSISHSQMQKSSVEAPLPFRGIARVVKIERRGKGYKADATYPRFLRSTPVTRLANWKLRSETEKGMAELIQQARDNAGGMGGSHSLPYGFNQTPTLHFYAPNRLVSVAVMGYTFTGGVHGNYGTDAKNYGLLRGESRPRQLNLGDFFRAGAPYRAHIEKMLLAKLRATKGTQREATFVIDGSVKSIPTELLNNFVAEKGGLRWFFPPYAVGPFFAGEHEVKLSIAELGSDFKIALLQMPR
jgi:hypothetical protein